MTVTRIDAQTQLKNRFSAIQCVIGGNGVIPNLGLWGQFSIPLSCTILGWTLTADQVGSAIIDVRRGTYSGFPAVASITGGAPPTLSGAQKAQNLNVSNIWATAINAGDVVEFFLQSASGLYLLNLALNISIP